MPFLKDCSKSETRKEMKQVLKKIQDHLVGCPFDDEI